MIGPGEIFTILFVTLGPLKLLGPFAQRTHALDEKLVRTIALRTFVIATIAAILGGFIGMSLAAKWQIPLGTMTITAGIIFFIVALRQLLEQYQPSHEPVGAPLPSSPTAAAFRLVFPIVLTPYGIATVIVLLTASERVERTVTIVGLLLIVLMLDLLGMLFARRIMAGFTLIALQLLGAVLAVLQAALSVQFVVVGLQLLGVLKG